MMTAVAHDYRIRHLIWRDKLGNVIAHEYEIRARSDSNNRLKPCCRLESLSEARQWLESRGVDSASVPITESRSGGSE